MSNRMRLIGLDGLGDETPKVPPCYTLDRLTDNAPYIGDIIQDYNFWTHLFWPTIKTIPTDGSHYEIKEFSSGDLALRQNGRWLSDVWDADQNGVPCHKAPQKLIPWDHPGYWPFCAGGPFKDKVGNIIFINWQGPKGTSPTELADNFRRNGIWGIDPDKYFQRWNYLIEWQNYTTNINLNIDRDYRHEMERMSDEGWIGKKFLGRHVAKNAEWIYGTMKNRGVDVQKQPIPMNFYFETPKIISSTLFSAAIIGAVVVIAGVVVAVVGGGEAGTKIASKGMEMVSSAINSGSKPGGSDFLKAITGSDMSSSFGKALINPNSSVQNNTTDKAGDIYQQVMNGKVSPDIVKQFTQNGNTLDIMNVATSIFGLGSIRRYRRGMSGNDTVAAGGFTTGGAAGQVNSNFVLNYYYTKAGWIPDAGPEYDTNTLKTILVEGQSANPPDSYVLGHSKFFWKNKGIIRKSVTPPHVILATQNITTNSPFDINGGGGTFIQPQGITAGDQALIDAAMSRSTTFDPSAAPTLFDQVNHTLHNLRNMLIIPQLADGLTSQVQEKSIAYDLYNAKSMSELPVMKNLFHAAVSGGYVGSIPMVVADKNGNVNDLISNINRNTGKETSSLEMKNALVRMALGCPVSNNVFNELSVLSCEDDIRKLKQGMSASTLQYVLPAGLPADKAACFANYLKSLGVDVITGQNQPPAPYPLENETEFEYDAAWR